jgi:hypothetical protein
MENPLCKTKLLKKRIMYLKAQVAAGARLDGWSLRGAKKELTELKKTIKMLYV